jgi:hypothetical protein
MATNPIPDGTVNLSANGPVELRDAIDWLAKQSGCSRSKYIVRLLEKARAERWVLSNAPPIFVKAAAEDPTSYGPSSAAEPSSTEAEADRLIPFELPEPLPAALPYIPCPFHRPERWCYQTAPES